MSKKTKKVLKVVGIIMVVWLGIGFTNYLIYSKIVTSSKGNAQVQGPNDESTPPSNGGGGSGGGGGFSTGSWWQTTWMGPLCWEDMSKCWGGDGGQ